MNWVQRKIYLYNVTFGLYMLDWWERFLFNMLVVVLMWFVCYNGFRYASEVCRSGCIVGGVDDSTHKSHLGQDFDRYIKNTGGYSDISPSAGP